ncbi:MAG: hypothetical protein IT447_03670 [Phycisphaerales bacterium]|jgi:stress-induced morphogen|nr:hypothetical protein [Phycisphaerales bacterium]
MTETQMKKLKHKLEQRFGAQVDVEPINGRGRYRFAVVSKKFAKMTHLQRQDALWEVADETLSNDATMDISLILAFAPNELETAK